MDPVHREVLRRLRPDLSRELLVSDSIVPFLFSEGVLTESQAEDIESQSTNTLKTLKLLDLLPTRGPGAFKAFLRSLEDYSWVRDRLELELQTRTTAGTSSTDVPQVPDSVLQRVPSDRDLSRLASRLGPQWESVLMDLGLSVESVFRCRCDHQLSAHGATLAGLIQWRRSEGRKATVQRLLRSLQAADVHPSVLLDVLT